MSINQDEWRGDFADQRSEAMPITVPTIRRGADGFRYKKLLVLISESDYD